MVLDRAAHTGLVTSSTKPDAFERSDVVGDGAEAGAEPAGELDRAGGAFVEHREDPHP